MDNVKYSIYANIIKKSKTTNILCGLIMLYATPVTMAMMPSFLQGEGGGGFNINFNPAPFELKPIPPVELTHNHILSPQGKVAFGPVQFEPVQFQIAPETIRLIGSMAVLVTGLCFCCHYFNSKEFYPAIGSIIATLVALAGCKLI